MDDPDLLKELSELADDREFLSETILRAVEDKDPEAARELLEDFASHLDSYFLDGTWDPDVRVVEHVRRGLKLYLEGKQDLDVALGVSEPIAISQGGRPEKFPHLQLAALFLLLRKFGERDEEEAITLITHAVGVSEETMQNALDKHFRRRRSDEQSPRMETLSRRAALDLLLPMSDEVAQLADEHLR